MLRVIAIGTEQVEAQRTCEDSALLVDYYLLLLLITYYLLLITYYLGR